MVNQVKFRLGRFFLDRKSDIFLFHQFGNMMNIHWIYRLWTTRRPSKIQQFSEILAEYPRSKRGEVPHGPGDEAAARTWWCPSLDRVEPQYLLGAFWGFRDYSNSWLILVNGELVVTAWWWLEPWNFMTFHSVGNNHHPNWRTPSFFRGVQATNQIRSGKSSPNGHRIQVSEIL